MTSSLHIVCPHCDAVNRLPVEKIADGGTCGRCKGVLVPGKPIDLDPARFAIHASRNDLPLVVDFWAPWCGPCRMMAPAFETVAERLASAAIFAKVNTEAHPELATRFGIRSIPTLAVMKNGRETARQAGAMDAQALQSWISSVL